MQQTQQVAQQVAQQVKQKINPAIHAVQEQRNAALDQVANLIGQNVTLSEANAELSKQVQDASVKNTELNDEIEVLTRRLLAHTFTPEQIQSIESLGTNKK